MNKKKLFSLLAVIAMVLNLFALPLKVNAVEGENIEYLSYNNVITDLNFQYENRIITPMITLDNNSFEGKTLYSMNVVLQSQDNPQETLSITLYHSDDDMCHYSNKGYTLEENEYNIFKGKDVIFSEIRIYGDNITYVINDSELKVNTLTISEDPIGPDTEVNFDDYWVLNNIDIVQFGDAHKVFFDIKSTEKIDNPKITRISLCYIQNDNKVFMDFILNDSSESETDEILMYNSETNQWEGICNYNHFDINGTYKLDYIDVEEETIGCATKNEFDNSEKFNYVYNGNEVYIAPEIISMKGIDHNSQVPLSGEDMYLKLDTEFKINDTRGKLESNLYYVNTENGKITMFEMIFDEEFQKYIIKFDEEYSLAKNSYKFLYATTKTVGDIYPQECQELYFTPFDRGYFENLIAEYSEIKEYLPISLESIHFETPISNLDFSIKYVEDNKAPTIIKNTINYQKDVITQPDIIKLQMNVTDNNGSGISAGKILYKLNNSIHISYDDNFIGGINDNQQITFSIEISRYFEVNDFQVLGIMIEDRAGNIGVYYYDLNIDNDVQFDNVYGEWYFEERMSELGIKSNTSLYYLYQAYYFETYNGNIGEGKLFNKENINKMDTSLRKLTFKKFQDYERIIESPKNPNDINFIEEINDLKEGKDENAVYVISYKYNTSKISKKVFEAIKDKKITLIFDIVIYDQEDSWEDMSVQWIIRGQDVTQLEQMEKDVIDVSIDIEMINSKVNNEIHDILDIDYYEFNARRYQANFNYIEFLKKQEGTDYYINYLLNNFDMKKDNFFEKLMPEFYKYYQSRIVFAENKTLPGKMTIRYNKEYMLRDCGSIGSTLKIDNMNCYYLDDNDNLSLIGSNIPLSLDNCFEFDITHNSTYILTQEKLLKENINLTLKGIVEGKVIDLTKEGISTQQQTLVIEEGTSLDETKIKELNELAKKVKLDGYKLKGIFLDKQATKELNNKVVFEKDTDLYMVWEKVVDEPEISIDPKPEDKPEDKTDVNQPSDNVNDQVESEVKTSDDTNITLYVVIASIALVGAGIMLYQKKKYENK